MPSHIKYGAPSTKKNLGGHELSQINYIFFGLLLVSDPPRHRLTFLPHGPFNMEK
jgi:hypothetical protein